MSTSTNPDLSLPLAQAITLTRGPHFTWRAFLTTTALVGLFFMLTAIVLVAVTRPAELPKEPFDIFFFTLGVGLGAFAFSVPLSGVAYFTVLGVRKSISASEARIEKISKSSEELQGALEQDFVTNLVRINFKYIDAYYLQTRIQADKSFTFTVFAAMVSLGLIIAGIILTFFDKQSSATISAAAGVLGQFISAVFFYLYNQTVAKMADYHRKLVFTQNIGLALKISDGLPTEEKTKAQVSLIETLSTNINQYLAA
jgi:hypothetical protein